MDDSVRVPRCERCWSCRCSFRWGRAGRRAPRRVGGPVSRPLMAPTITAPGPRLIRARSPASAADSIAPVDVSGLAVDRLRERQRLGPADGRPGRDAGAADDALAAAEDEEALHLDAVLAVVLAGHGADDVVVRERVGRRALRAVRLRREDVERRERLRGRAREPGVRERHPVLRRRRPRRSRSSRHGRTAVPSRRRSS